MKDSCRWLISSVLILFTTEMVLASLNPAFDNPGGANQVSVRLGAANGLADGCGQEVASNVRIDSEGRNVNAAKVGHGGEIVELVDKCRKVRNGDGDDISTVDADGTIRLPDGTARYKNGLEMLSEEILRVETPMISLSIFDREYSVGGRCVELPVELVPDGYYDTNSKQASWTYPENVFRMRASDYYQVCSKNQVCRKDGDYHGLEITSNEEFWKILHHEALHADFTDKYRSLIEADMGYAAFVTEMLSYVGANGYGEKIAAEHILKSYPNARYWARKYLDEMDAKQCANEKNILRRMGNPKLLLPEPSWRCDTCGAVFENGEDLAGHLLGGCSPPMKKERKNN